ncbi:cyclin-A1-4 [Chenopodium quinoa]|uniref:cyclin-A1-4 n=1 Tax=Chenopodium quinoa TaxID=63459 RepID=UPI000B79284E|nr:cyclin-A1-4 [Chenopodium quinoa]
MSTLKSHRKSLGSSAASKRQATKIPASENVISNSKPNPNNRKRPPLSNLTNQSRPSVSSAATIPHLVPCATSKNIKAKKGYATSFNSTNFPGSNLPALLTKKPNVAASSKTSLPRNDVVEVYRATSPKLSRVGVPSASSRMDISPSRSDADSVSMEDSMSTCDSVKSPEFEYLDESESALLGSIQRKTSENLHIDDKLEIAGNYCKREILSEMDVDKVVDVDDKYMDPQFCATIACDIYKHLRASETLKRPATDFIEKIQKDINASMRAILIDWLVEVAEEYRLVPDTLYLTVNYIDRYLSGNTINRQRLQLLGVACMMIASKYEEICAPQVEEFCYITDNTYLKEEVLEMEATVLNFLKFEMTAPTTKCFLRRFIRSAQVMSEAPSMQLECLSNYVAELSLLDYNMLQYAPSLTAASSVFLAKYILSPSKRPWNSTLLHYTLYKPSDLLECVKALHQLCLSSHSSSLSAIREKYSQHKYKFVAKKNCPPSIPSEYFSS